MTSATGVVSRTCVKTGDGVIELRDVEIGEPRAHEALLRVRLSTVCGSDIHFVDDFPMPKRVESLPMGHEAVATVAAVGDDVRGFAEGDRVVASCLYGCGACPNCLTGALNLCTTYGAKMPGMSNTLAGCQGEYFLVPHADVNMARVPDGVADEEAILAGDIMSTGFGAVEAGGMRAGDTVAVFAQGPVGLCATAGARALGAGLVVAVESVPERVAMAQQLGANAVFAPEDAVEGIAELTGRRGVDVAIEALGRPETFAAALEVARVGGAVSSVGVYASERSLPLPVDGRFYQRRIVTSLCPSGCDRLQRLMRILEHGRTGLGALFTHRMALSQTVEAYDLFKHRRDGAIKIALVPEDTG